MHEEFKEQYQKMRDPDFDQETVFKPPKPYFFFGENIVLIDEKENHSKYYFLKHECERIANEKKKKGF